MDDPTSSAAWWLALAAAVIAYLLVACTRVAFRLLGPVSVSALADRLGAERAEFLRKSLRGPTPLWFSLHVATSVSLATLLVVLFGGRRVLTAGAFRFSTWPTGEALHDVGLVALLAVVVGIMEYGVPVLLARADPGRVVVLALPALRALHVLLLPLSGPLARWSGNSEDDDADTEAGHDEVSAFIDVGQREGILEGEEGELLRNLVTFGDTRVHEVMTPRTDLVSVPDTATVQDVVRLMATSRYSRLPVHSGGLDDVKGVVTLKDAVGALQTGHGGDKAVSLLRKAFIVPESKRVAELLPELQASRQQVALVVDEYGGTAGLVTIEDLLEELVGEIREEHEVLGDDVLQTGDGTWLVRARTPLHDVGEAVGLPLDHEEASTLGGLLLALCDRVPRPGETFDYGGLRFDVEEADRRRVQLVRVTRAATGGSLPPVAEQDHAG